MGAPTISLVTGTWNRPDAFRRLVKAVFDRARVPTEIVVADCSEKPVASSDFPGLPISVIHDWPKTSMVRGYNRCFARARGDWVVWANDDAEPLPGWDEAALVFMQGHPEVGMGAVYYSQNGGPFHVNEYQGHVYANFGFLKRKLGDSLGWYDIDLRMYGSDNSLTLKVLLAGLGVVGIPGAYWLHHSVQDQQRMANEKLQSVDATILHENYKDRFAAARAVFEKYRHLQKDMCLSVDVASAVAGRAR